MTAFTRLGSSIWDWDPWTDLSGDARVLWLALYTSPAAKRHLPGLWHGGIPSMADAARMTGAAVVSALDELLERDLVEYDAKLRVLRLTQLPDCGEYPANGKVIKSWWTRFRTVPDCPVRNAHIRTLRWVLDEGASRAGKQVTDHHEEAWGQTFGTVAIPSVRRRGVRTIGDSDTSTSVQPSLFPSAASTPPSGAASSGGNGLDERWLGSYPQVHAQAVDNSAALHQSSKIRGPETVSDTVCDTHRIPDPGSRILRSSSSGDPAWSPVEITNSAAPHVAPPALRLVPPYTATDVVAVLRSEGVYDPTFESTHHDALAASIPSWVARGVTLDDFARYGQLVATSKALVSSRQLVGAADLPGDIARAKAELDQRDVRLKMLAEFMPTAKGGP